MLLSLGSYREKAESHTENYAERLTHCFWPVGCGILLWPLKLGGIFLCKDCQIHFSLAGSNQCVKAPPS